MTNGGRLEAMLRLVPLWLLSGCQAVFPVPDVPGTDAAQPGEQVCGNELSLFRGCVTVRLDRFEPGGSLDTGDPATDAQGDCTEVITQDDPARTEVCAIAAREVVVANTFALGKRPLLLASLTTLTVDGVLSASSKTSESPGAGANFAGCPDLDAGASGGTLGGGGGGAGGSLGSNGGSGGLGQGGHAGSDATPGNVTLFGIRGGCPGAAGGTSLIGGAGGNGGGALYLLAGTEITISGRVEASGSGGFGGTIDAQAGGGGGGGGGGSGGLLVLDAASITVAGNGSRLIANGGGGGGGGGPMNDAIGTDGDEPDPVTFPFAAPGGGGNGAGDGGLGANALVFDNVMNNGAGNSPGPTGGGGGGGGGGLGYLLLYGTRTTPGITASPVPSN